MIKTLQINLDSFKYMPETIKRSNQYTSMLFKKDGLLLEYAHEDIKNYDRCVRLAVKNNPDSLKFASDRIKKDYKFIRELYKDARSNLNKELLLNHVSPQIADFTKRYFENNEKASRHSVLNITANVGGIIPEAFPMIIENND